MIVIADLIAEIERARDELQEETYPPFFKDIENFVRRKKVNTVKQISALSIDDIADFFLLVTQGIFNNTIFQNHDVKTGDELEDLVAASWDRIKKSKDIIKTLLNHYSFEEMVFLSEISLRFDADKVEAIKRLLIDESSSKSKNRIINSFYELFGKSMISDETNKFIKSIKEKGLEQETINFLSEFANIFRDSHDSCAFDILIGYIYVKQRYSQIRGDNGLNRESRRLNQGYIDIAVEVDTLDLIGYQNVFSAYSDLERYINNYGAQLKQKNNIVNAIKEVYKKVLIKLKTAAEKDEITNINDLVKGLSDDDPIKKKIILWVAEHNKAEYDRLLETYNELVSKDINIYRSIFNKHGINISDDEIYALIPSKDTTLKTIPSPEDTDKIIGLLRWFSPDEKLSILKVTSLERATSISQFVSSGYCSVEFVKNHIDIYNLNSSTYDKYTNALTL